MYIKNKTKVKFKFEKIQNKIKNKKMKTEFV